MSVLRLSSDTRLASFGARGKLLAVPIRPVAPNRASRFGVAPPHSVVAFAAPSPPVLSPRPDLAEPVLPSRSRRQRVTPEKGTPCRLVPRRPLLHAPFATPRRSARAPGTRWRRACAPSLSTAWRACACRLRPPKIWPTTCSSSWSPASKAAPWPTGARPPTCAAPRSTAPSTRCAVSAAAPRCPSRCSTRKANATARGAAAS